MPPVDFNTFVQKLAKASADSILPFFRSTMAHINKASSGFDPVTEADRAAENAMRQMIMRHFPTHGIIGEEMADHLPNAEYKWYLDPIDGTKSFISGLPTWGTLIALTKNEYPIFGMMNQPFVQDQFYGDGEKSENISARGHLTLKTSKRKTLDQAILFTTSPTLMNEDERKKFYHLEKQVKLSRYGGDCYIYCQLAAGNIDLVMEAGLALHDIMALIPIIRGAGGIITNWQGNDDLSTGQVLASANLPLHEKALKVIQS